MGYEPRWLRDLDEAVLAGFSGVILSNNVQDRVYAEASPSRSLPYFLAARLAGQGFRVGSYSLAHGLRDVSPPEAAAGGASPFGGRPPAHDPEEALAFIDELLRGSRSKLAILVDYADHLAPAADSGASLLSPLHTIAAQYLHSWASDDQIKANGHLVVLLSPEGQVNDLLRKGGGLQTIDVPLPALEDRLGFTTRLEELRKRDPQRFGSLAADLSPSTFAELAAGLRLSDIEAMYRLAGARQEPIHRARIAEVKARAIAELGRGLIEIHEPTFGFEAVAGLPHVIEYLTDLKRRYADGDVSVPQAIAFVGPPGTGKSFVVKALAKELNLPLLALRNIRDRWVGASEQRLEQVLAIVRTLAPCVVWWDELELSFGGRRSGGGSGDSGTSDRLMARWFEFLGGMEHRGRILLAGTSNRPDLLDPATVDRFGVILPLIHPSPTDVAALLPVVAAEVGHTLASDVQPLDIARLSTLRYPSVRGLQEVVGWAGALASRDAGQRVPIDHRHLDEAARDYMPSCNALEQEAIVLTALNMTSLGSNLPWRSRGGWRTGAQVPEYVEDLLDGDGRLDKTRLQDRLEDRLRRLSFDQALRRV